MANHSPATMQEIPGLPPAVIAVMLGALVGTEAVAAAAFSSVAGGVMFATTVPIAILVAFHGMLTPRRSTGSLALQAMERPDDSVASLRRVLRRDVDRAERYGHRLSIAILHVAPGAEHAAAGSLRNITRDSDSVCELATGRLAVVLPQCAQDQAAQLAERVAQEVHSRIETLGPAGPPEELVDYQVIEYRLAKHQGADGLAREVLSARRAATAPNRGPASDAGVDEGRVAPQEAPGCRPALARADAHVLRTRLLGKSYRAPAPLRPR